MSKQRTKGRRLPFAATVGLTLGVLIVFGAFAGGAVSAPQAGQEMPTPRSGPSVAGTPQEGNTLEARGGQWLYANGLDCSSRPEEPCKITWQWQRCNPAATSCGDIAGATGTSYLLTAADVGSRIRIVQTLTKNDCNAHGVDCRDVSSPQVSAPTNLVAPKPVTVPSVRELPQITGTAMEEETLTASTGLWDGPQPISVGYQWYRCDANGNGCVPIAGATAQTYQLTAADVGFTIRVTGTATNAGGSAFATSSQTPVVAAFGPTPQRPSITIDRVTSPHRLVLDEVEFIPETVRSRRTFTMRVRLKDTRGFLIQGGRVKALSVPFGLLSDVPEVQTSALGWATMRLTPTDKFELKTGRLFIFIRARKSAGETAKAPGVSVRDLVNVRVVAPTRK
jgi:hypothetical protein